MPRPHATDALASVSGWLPERGAALDLAGGDGGQAVWLAQRGLDVTLCDVSSVALQRATLLAASAGVALQTVCIDLEEHAPPAGPWDLVLCTNYVQPQLWPAVARSLSAGGRAVWIHPTLENLARNAKPSRRFLLESGQALAVFEAAGLTISFADESWVAGRHVSRVVGCPPA